MDRQIVYAGAIPLDTDQLLQNRSTMVALGYLAKAVIGDDRGYIDGLACTPASGLSVLIAPGSITSPGIVDANAYGSLPPDGDPLVKIGINTGAITLTAPGAGQFVVSAVLAEQQTGSSATMYYNAADAAEALIGTQGDGAPQASVVTQRVSLNLTTPDSVPIGAVRLYNLTIPNGALSVSSSMISVAPTAPFLTVKLPEAAPLSSPAFVGGPTAPTPSVGDASALIATTQFVATACSRNRAAWGTGGVYNWICPPGVSRVMARLWAAGGPGGSANSGNPGGGGGGGGYVEVLLNVQAGTSYTIQVGGGSNGNGASKFDTLVQVTPGLSGGDGSGTNAGAGGASGNSSSSGSNIVGMIGVAGGYSGFVIGNTSVGGAGGATYGNSGGHPAFGRQIGLDGIWPGGGGSGGSSAGGGRGADGLVVIEWGG